MLNIIKILTSINRPKTIGVININNQADYDTLNISSGDIISFAKGVTFNVNIDEIADNLVIRSHGSGTNPILRGSDDLSSDLWTNVGGYYTTPKTINPNWIFKDGTPIKMAETSWITVPYSSNNTTKNTVTINHGDVSTYTDIVGSYVLVQHRVFRTAYLRTVIAYNGSGIITLDGNVDFNEPGGRDMRLKLLNDVEYFAGNGEFVWRNNILNIKDNASPDILNYRESPNNHVINLIGTGNSISNVTIQESYSHLIKSDNKINVSNCELKGTKGAGLVVTNSSDGSEVTNNTIHDCGYNGLSLISSINPIISGNTIYNIGLQSNYPIPIDTSLPEHEGTAIALFTTSSLTIGGIINNNSIYNTAYLGIICGGVNRSVYRNIIHDVLQLFEDGGAIYTWAGHEIGTKRAQGIDIYENFIYDIPEAVNTHNAGIYFDNGSYQCKARGNTIYNCIQEGIFQNVSSSDIEISGTNTIVGSKINININEGTTTATYQNVENTILESNILVVKLAANINMGISMEGANNPYQTSGFGDNNYYVNPYGTTIAKINGSNRTLTQLKTDFSEDANSIEHTNYIAAPGDPENEILLVTNPSDSVLNGTAPAGTWKDVNENIVTNYTIQSWSSLLLLKDL
jgi:parallel beta-helix repeat protein